MKTIEVAVRFTFTVPDYVDVDRVCIDLPKGGVGLTYVGGKYVESDLVEYETMNVEELEE